MRVLKTIGLGVAFSFAGFFILSFFLIKRGLVGIETSHATGVSAIIGALLEAIVNPITLLVFVIAFVAAYLLVRKTSKRTSTS